VDIINNKTILSSSLPQFATFEGSYVTIDPTDPDSLGSYTFRVTATDTIFGNITASVNWEVIITDKPTLTVNKGPPMFQEPLNNFNVSLGQIFSVVLPIIEDPDGDSFTMKIQNFVDIFKFTV
jgi:hypothetical protein